MALVMLPCDMPWWPTIQRYLTQISIATNTKQLLVSMQKIINLCNVGLDPDETDVPDNSILINLEKFLENGFDDSERNNFFTNTLPCMTRRALDLKRLRPPNGLRFSLQQQSDRIEYDREFVASLLAHSFFSTFPKRVLKTHPTLQDFNFTNFFRHLDNQFQRCKLLSLFHYFNFLEKSTCNDKIILSRQVMSSVRWLTLEDWVNCRLPLCPLLIRRQGSIYDMNHDHIRICSTSSRIGGGVLSNGKSMECIQIITCPEMLFILLNVECLEDNEVLMVESVYQVTKICEPNSKPSLLYLPNPLHLTICCMDAEDYKEYPILQFQQDSVLRELNKALTGFKQTITPTTINKLLPRRLSPIGESFSSTPEKTVSTQTEKRSHMDTLQVRRKFILLGSSGECLPITRRPSKLTSCNSTSVSIDISPESEFHSCRTSFTDEDFEDNFKRITSLKNIDTEERRILFSQRLQDALDRAIKASLDSFDSETSETRDGSCGFFLEGESTRDTSSYQERRFNRAASSKYSFTTDCSNELELVYEQLGKWLDEDETLLPVTGTERETIREKAVIQFAGNLLKRTLSESFVGIPLNEDFAISEELTPKKTDIKKAARSLSLELARHKNKLAAQLVSVALNQDKGGSKPIATYNWGCSSRCGDPQLKLIIQWLAASVALVPHLVYFTAANVQLNKLDTVCRMLLDRQWSVGELISVILKFNEFNLITPPGQNPLTLFEYIIALDEKAPTFSFTYNI